MATNTLIQNLNTELYSAYPGEPNEGVPTSSSHRRQVETFIASAAIAAGDLVAFDFSKTEDGDKALYVIKADIGTGTSSCAVGVALAGAAADERCDVVVAGICEANVATCVAGDRLQAGSTAGRASVAPDIDEAGSATIAQAPIIAYACEADTTNVATIFVLKQF